MKNKNKNKYLISDKEWNLVSLLAERNTTKRANTVDPRLALSACLGVFEHGLAWKEIPDFFGISVSTARGYYKKLRQQRKWNLINNILGQYRQGQGRKYTSLFSFNLRATALTLVALLVVLPVSPVFAQDVLEQDLTPAPQLPTASSTETVTPAAAEQKTATEKKNDSQPAEAVEATEESIKAVEEVKINLGKVPKDGAPVVEEKPAAEKQATVPRAAAIGEIEKQLAKTETAKKPVATETEFADVEKNTEPGAAAETVKQPVESGNKTSDKSGAETNEEINPTKNVEQKNAVTSETPAEENTEVKAKTVYAIKEIAKKETSDNASVSQTENDGSAKGVVAGESTSIKQIIENKTPHPEEVVAAESQPADEAESTNDELIPEASGMDGADNGAEEPVDEQSLREQLRQEVLAEIMQGCLEFEDSSYYCADEAAQDSEADYTERWLSLFSARKEADLQFDEEIYFEKDGKQVRLTDRKTRDMFLAQDVAGRSAVWQSLINGRWQIFYYDQQSQEPKQLTSGNYNNMNPQIYDGTVVWQAWVDGDWDVFLAEKQTIKLVNSGTASDGLQDAASEGWILRQITDNNIPDLFPRIAAGIVTWQSFRNGAWQVMAYDLESRTTTQLSAGPGNYENPRFSIIWDDRQETGEVYTVGYDISSGELQNLTEKDQGKKNSKNNDGQPLEEDAIMATRVEGSQNQQNKNKNENGKTQN